MSSHCNLPEDRLRERMAMIRREILPRATRRQALPDGVALEFEHSSATQKDLEDLVAFERRCCGGLEWDLSHPSEGVLRLSVKGVDPDSDFFRLAADAPSP